MNDELDFYISRCLKNWSARHQPAGGIREAILHRAGSPPTPQEGILRRVLNFLNAFGASERHAYVRDQGDWIIGSPSHSQIWILHIATSWRLAH